MKTLLERLSECLNKQEFEVIQQMALGYSNQEISSIMHLTIHSTNNYISNIYKKIDIPFKYNHRVYIILLYLYCKDEFNNKESIDFLLKNSINHEFWNEMIKD